MSINLPHEFPSLFGGNKIPVLIVGSGPSSELVPTHADLFNNECQQAEERLKCDSGIDFNNPGDNNLYSWATAIKAELEKKGVPLPKLKIAEELRILDDLRWRPKVKYRPLQTLARHRVIARFVREERLEAIWSLNWDTLLEIALESIGMSHATNVAQDQFPWKTKYKTFVTVDDYADDDNVFMLHKPHGCVRSLILAKEALKNGDPDGRAERLCERFLITEEEMKSFDGRQEDQDDNFYSEIRVKFSKRSLYTLGWRAAVEEYLLEFLEKIPESTGNLYIGPLRIHPSLEVSGTYDDNVLGATNDPVHDFYNTYNPKISLALPMRDHSIEFDYRYTIIEYEGFSSRVAEQDRRLNFGDELAESGTSESLDDGHS